MNCSKPSARYGIILAGMASCLLSFAADTGVGAAFARTHCVALDVLARFLNTVGDWPAHTVAGIFAMVAASLAGRRRLVLLLAAMLLASTFAGLTANAVRLSTGRPRPSTPVQDGFYGLRKEGKWIAFKNSYKAFPSAHTATAAAFGAVALIARMRGGWMVLGLFGPAVGCARIYSHAHHFSDVITSLFLGLLFAVWAWNFMNRHEALLRSLYTLEARVFPVWMLPFFVGIRRVRDFVATPWGAASSVGNRVGGLET